MYIMLYFFYFGVQNYEFIFDNAHFFWNKIERKCAINANLSSDSRTEIKHKYGILSTNDFQNSHF